MSRPLIDSNAWAELFNKFKAQNPNLADHTADQFKPYKLEAGQNGRNTRIRVVAYGNLAITGNLAIDYDRLDPTAALAKFGPVTKVPTVRYFGNVGDMVTTTQLLDKMNIALGTNLSMSGDYPDLVDSSFTLPAKNASSNINLLTHPGAGVPPFSLRFKGNANVPLKLANMGKVVSDSLVGRSLNPWRKTDNTLAWDLYPRNMASLSVSSDLILKNMDWSDLFGTEALLAAAFDPTPTYSNGTVVLYKFKPEILAIINKRLNAFGLPSITSTRNVLYPYTNLATVGVNTYLNYASTTSASARTFTRTDGFYIFDGTNASKIALPAQANSAFTYVLKVYPKDWSGTVCAESLAGYTTGNSASRPMLFHFNAL